MPGRYYRAASTLEVRLASDETCVSLSNVWHARLCDSRIFPVSQCHIPYGIAKLHGGEGRNSDGGVSFGGMQRHVVEPNRYFDIGWAANQTITVGVSEGQYRAKPILPVKQSLASPSVRALMCTYKTRSVVETGRIVGYCTAIRGGKLTVENDEFDIVNKELNSGTHAIDAQWPFQSKMTRFPHKTGLSLIFILTNIHRG
ncbi:hypothetical protein EV421DRAFT_2025927 [Armillaria borealis]|uniref:Uncharacterized protein n=1 Tax=Armillaria borealis TaxID=47425 RepID=A0AA39ISH2_9AGAR|nr:hypothetical protein EV421DRAFT_2025927 [Armillaria borealis]